MDLLYLTKIIFNLYFLLKTAYGWVSKLPMNIKKKSPSHGWEERFILLLVTR